MSDVLSDVGSRQNATEESSESPCVGVIIILIIYSTHVNVNVYDMQYI